MNYIGAGVIRAGSDQLNGKIRNWFLKAGENGKGSFGVAVFNAKGLSVFRSEENVKNSVHNSDFLGCMDALRRGPSRFIFSISSRKKSKALVGTAPGQWISAWDGLATSPEFVQTDEDIVIHQVVEKYMAAPKRAFSALNEGSWALISLGVKTGRLIVGNSKHPALSRMVFPMGEIFASEPDLLPEIFGMPLGASTAIHLFPPEEILVIDPGSDQQREVLFVEER